MELPLDLSKLIFQELFWYQQHQPYGQFDGLNCGGVPTRTTPTITPVTPTTLRSIEQTFLDYQPDVESHQNEAGFEPPLVQPTTSMPGTTGATSSLNISTASSVSDNVGGGSIFMNIVDTKSWQGGTTTITEMPPLIQINANTMSPPIPPHVMSIGSGSNSSSSSSSSSSTSSTSSKKNIGGRRPNKENGISPEEEERRKLRRERNKLAAARCRKRRLDHTNELQEETNELEGKKQRLEEEIQQLKMQKQELEFLLENHVPHCRLRDTESPEDVKPFILNPAALGHHQPQQQHLSHHQQHQQQQQHMSMVDSTENTEKPMIATTMEVVVSEETKVFTSLGIPVNINDTLATMSASGSLQQQRQQRPNSLPVSSTFVPKSGKMVGGVQEMAGISITTPSNGLTLNFDSLMEGGTGLTPITSSFIPSCSTQLRNAASVVDLSSPDSVPTKLVSL